MFFFQTFLFKTSKENRISKYKMFVPLFRLSCCRDSQPDCILIHSNNQLYEISSTLNRLNCRMKTLAVDNPVDTSISHHTIVKTSLVKTSLLSTSLLQFCKRTSLLQLVHNLLQSCQANILSTRCEIFTIEIYRQLNAI